MNGNLLNRDFSLKALLILGTLAAAAALAGGMGLRFPPGDAAKPLAMAGTLAGAAAFYCRVRKVPGFAQAATAIAQLVLFSACYAVLMYALAGAARPLVDDTLVRADRLLGLETPDAMAWAAAHPAAGRCLGLAYNTVLPQTALAVAALGFLGDRRRLEAFVLRFMLAALLTAALFWLWPAEGPFSAYGYAPSPSQARYLEHLRAMRGGGMTTVTWRGAEGLISFPSFHTAWAILLTLSVRRRPAAFAAAACLNAAVVAATLTTGWHYASDALGGALVCAVAVALARLLGGGADDPGAVGRTGGTDATRRCGTGAWADRGTARNAARVARSLTR